MENTKQNGLHDNSNQLDNVAYIPSADDCLVAVTTTSKTVLVTEPFPNKDKPQIRIDTRFGYGRLKPKCFQFFNKIGFLVLWLMIFCFLEGFAVNGIANAGLPGIERQFQLTSSKSSLIPASQDIGALCLVMFVSFIGGRHNKPVWIACGSLIMAAGSFIFIIPHLVEKYNYEGSESGTAAPVDTCNGTGPVEPHTCNSAGGGKWLGVFAVSQLVSGIGFTPMFTLGTVYLDENSNPATAAVYVGLCYACTAIGVAVGFLSGGQFMQNWFVDFDRIDQKQLGFDATDTRWVGSWWLGFLFSTIAFAVIAIPIFGYPKYLPVNPKAEESEAALQKDKDILFCQLVVNVLKDFLVAFIRLAKNPTFIFITLAGCAESLIIFGVSAFAFKYLAEMYNMGFDTAGMLLGGLILVGAGGMFLGGLLIRIFRLETVGMLRLNVIVTLIAGLLGISYLAACPDVQLAGLAVPYPHESFISGYRSSCNKHCACDSVAFNPVCGDDKLVYYSACHAGCIGTPSAHTAPYTNCSCVTSRTNDSSKTATMGRCDDGCTNIKILAPCLFIMMIAVLTATTPSSMATLRCVEEDIRPFALGVGWLLLRLLGSIPGPILIGTIIDKACLISSSSACESTGNCLMYNKEKMSIGVLLWWVIVAAISSLLFFIASLCASRVVVKAGAYSLDKNESNGIKK